MRKLAIAIVILPVVAGTASAESLPPNVVARIASDERSCVGGPARIEKGFVTRKDVNGDGIPDYILDFNHLFCGPLQGYCGSGGFYEVVFASEGGQFVKVLDDLVDRLTFKKIKGRPAAVLVTGGASCGEQSNADPCFQTRLWNGRTFQAVR